MAAGRVPINCAVVGVQKAGTSTLHSLLAQHPAVARTRRKELHFFDDEGHDWQRPDYSGYAAKRSAEEQAIACDATPIYFFWPPALPRMKAYAPDMRLVALFRDPVERALSQWVMQTGRDDTTAGFDALVSESLDADDPQVPPDGWKSRSARTRSMVARGFYGHQLARGLESFPRDQWLLLDFLDLVRDQATVMRRVTDFLSIEPFVEPLSDEQRHKSAPVTDVAPGNPSAAVVDRLAKAYADDLQRFEELSGLSVARWPTARLLRGDLDSAEWAAELWQKTRTG